MKKIIKQINTRTVLIAIITFLLGWQIGHSEVAVKWALYKPTVSIVNKEPPSGVNVDFKLFWDTWDLLSRSYLDKKAVDPQKMFYGAISGMVASVGDPYTVFLPPEQQKITQDELNGSFDGVGIQLGFNEANPQPSGSAADQGSTDQANKDKRLVVVTPLTGTPAERSGIKPADVIVKIDDKDTQNISLPDAVKLIRGPKGTKVTLTIARAGDPDTKVFSLTRETIVVKSVEVSYKETKDKKQVAVIKLSRFGERTNDEWNGVVADIKAKNPAGVVLDVRNNPGGFLDGAVYIASEFLDGGDVVLQEHASGQRDAYKVNRQGSLLTIPMTVLINKGSASASEIVAGALQDRKRAQLVGEQSFGKGTIQEAQSLDGGAGIHITVAKWLTPNGRWVNELGGLKPDVTVVAKEVSKDNDPQLEKALELLD